MDFIFLYCMLKRGRLVDREIKRGRWVEGEKSGMKEKMKALLC